jgi:O-antigen/teichoic acid export membrane protein
MTIPHHTARTRSRQVAINAITSIGHVVAIGGIFFVLYRYLLATLGVEHFGVWVIVMAATSVTRISDLGLSTSIVKFVAKYVARDDHETAAAVVQTAVLSVAGSSAVVLAVGFPVAQLLLRVTAPEGALGIAEAILPFAVLSLWITLVTGVLLGGLDGCQRIDLRNAILVGSQTLHLVMAVMLVPRFGLMGLAYAQVLQAAVTLAVTWPLLCRYLPRLSLSGSRWRRDLFGEMIGYGLNVGIGSVANLLYDPTTKILLAKFGGLAMTGYYELASRLISQCRALIVSTNQVLVPVFADLHETSPGRIKALYQDSYRLLLYVGLPFFSTVIAVLPVVSEIWIGRYEGIFVAFATLLAAGWFLNTLNIPAYLANLGTGDLRSNTTANVLIAVLNLVLGFSFGSALGGAGVVVGWAVALASGGAVVAVSYHRKNGIPLRELFPGESGFLAAAGIVAAATCVLVYSTVHAAAGAWAAAASVMAICISINFLPIWMHPMRKQLTREVTRQLQARKTGLWKLSNQSSS